MAAQHGHEPWNWGLIIALLLDLAFWAVVIVLAVVALDWLIIIAVAAVVIAVYFAMTNLIDQLLDYWRAYKGEK